MIPDLRSISWKTMNEPNANYALRLPQGLSVITCNIKIRSAWYIVEFTFLFMRYQTFLLVFFYVTKLFAGIFLVILIFFGPLNAYQCFRYSFLTCKTKIQTVLKFQDVTKYWNRTNTCMEIFFPVVTLECLVNHLFIRF